MIVLLIVFIVLIIIANVAFVVTLVVILICITFLAGICRFFLVIFFANFLQYNIIFQPSV